MGNKNKKAVGKHLGIMSYHPFSGLYAAWRYSYTDYDDGSSSEDFYICDGLYRPKMSWETEEVTLIDDGGLKKLVRVKE